MEAGRIQAADHIPGHIQAVAGRIQAADKGSPGEAGRAEALLPEAQAAAGEVFPVGRLGAAGREAEVRLSAVWKRMAAGVVLPEPAMPVLKGGAQVQGLRPRHRPWRNAPDIGIERLNRRRQWMMSGASMTDWAL